MRNTTPKNLQYLGEVLRVFVCLSLSFTIYAASVPSIVQSFGSAAVNGSGVASTVVFSLSGVSSLPSTAIGGVDFTAGSLSCNQTYTVCTALVTFLPKSAGLRQDALTLKTSSGTLIASAFLNGIGTGPALRAFPASISTLAGNGNWNYVNGSATAASFRNPQGIAVDLSGDVYVADSVNQVIREIAVGTAVVTTIAGTGASGYSGDGGLATNATLNTPTGVAVDAGGNIFIADQQNGLIRRVDAVSKIISTVAGGGSSTANGVVATMAALSGPSAVAVDTAGNVYISDSFHNLVRKLTVATGLISTIAGGGTSAGTDGLGDGGAATSAQLNNPDGLSLDAAGDLFIADTGDSMIRRVDATSGIITVVAGTGGNGYSGDGGLATEAELGSPSGVRVDAAGNLYIADSAKNVIRLVNGSTGLISTIAGNGTAAYSGDGEAATYASLNSPTDVALDRAGDLMIADYANNVVRKVVFQPPTLTLPSTNVALTSPLVNVQLANFGTSTLNLSALSISAPFHQEPSGGTDCSATSALTSGASCNIDLAFIPVAAGAVTGTLTSASNNANISGTSFTVNLAGTGLSGTPQATLSAASLTFGSQAVGTTSAQQVLTVKNTGTATLSGISMAMSGLDPLDFTTTSTCSATLAASATCTISVAFGPSLAGTRTATLKIFDDASNSPQTVTLTGTGTGGAMGVLSTTSLQFGPQPLTTTSATQNITLTNSGIASLYIYGMSVGGTNTADFILSGTTCTASLAASGSCTISLKFAPLALGARTATLTLNGSTGFLQATLSGTGTPGPPIPALNATSFSFGQSVGYASTQISTLANVGGSSLTISGIAITAASGPGFAINGTTCGTTLAPAASCSVTIAFTPQSSSPESANLTFTFANASCPNVALWGSGISLTLTSTNMMSGFYDVPGNTPRINFVTADSHVHQLWIYNQAAWMDFDLTAAGNAPLVRSGSSVSGFETQSGPVVNYIATDSHVHQFYVAAARWHDIDLTATVGSPLVAANTAISGFFNSVNNTSTLTYVGADSAAHQLSSANGGAWSDLNLTGTTGAPSPFTGTSFAGFLDSGSNTLRINYIAGDSHVHQFWTNTAGNWNDFDLTAATGAPNAVINTAISAFLDAGGNTPRVNYVAVDSHVHQLWIWNQARWLDYDLTAATGGPGVATGTTISSFVDVAGNTPRINYVATDSHVHQLWIWNRAAWMDYDLTDATGAPDVNPGTSITGFIDPVQNTPRINYVATDSHVHQFWIWNFEAWEDYDLTAGTGAPDPI